MNSDDKKIAKNTLMLYFRMGLSMFVALFTSRVVLNTLGVEDYGIYNITGGIIGLLGFLNSSMAAATGRFITFELGKKNISNLKIIFNCAFIIHLVLAIFILLIAETIGIWFLDNKLLIPSDRMNAAFWVYQLSILSTIVSITQVPYSSCIVSHERLDIYAYVDIISIFLRLLIIYLLVIGDFDKLILYSFLTTCISIGTALFYRYYCHHNFSECRVNFKYNKIIIQKMLSFSGWDLFGNISVTIRGQGVSMIINMFYGVIINAACGIANQVSSTIMAFSSNILMAVRPQITKSYACKDYERCSELIKNSFLIITYLMAILIVPIILEINYILKIWLGTIPDFCPTFCILSLLFNFFSALAMLTLTIPHASGKNKLPSLINGTIYLTSLPITYIFYSFYDVVWFPYLYNSTTMMAGFIVIYKIATKYLPELSKKNILNKLAKNIFIILVIGSFIREIQYLFPNESFTRLLTTCTISFILISLYFFYWGIEKEHRNKITTIILNKIKG